MFSYCLNQCKNCVDFICKFSAEMPHQPSEIFLNFLQLCSFNGFNFNCGIKLFPEMWYLWSVVCSCWLFSLSILTTPRAVKFWHSILISFKDLSPDPFFYLKEFFVNSISRATIYKISREVDFFPI